MIYLIYTSISLSLFIYLVIDLDWWTSTWVYSPSFDGVRAKSMSTDSGPKLWWRVPTPKTTWNIQRELKAYQNGVRINESSTSFSTVLPQAFHVCSISVEVICRRHVIQMIDMYCWDQVVLENGFVQDASTPKQDDVIPCELYSITSVRQNRSPCNTRPSFDHCT